MQFKKTIPYKLKRIIPMLGIAGASLFMGGCEKEPITPTRDVELYFNIYNIDDIFLTGKIQDNVNLQDVRTVYLVPEGSFSNFSVQNIYNLVNNGLRPAINISPKVRGKGNFEFEPGCASQIPEDSTFIVNNGWTINAHLQNQR